MEEEGIFRDFDDSNSSSSEVEKKDESEKDKTQNQNTIQKSVPVPDNSAIDLSGVDNINEPEQKSQPDSSSKENDNHQNNQSDTQRADEQKSDTQNATEKKDGVVGSTQQEGQAKDYKSFAEASKLKGGNGKQKKPPKLNKTVILSALISVGLLIIGFIIFAPTETLSAKTDKSKNQPTQGQFGDYENMAENDPKSSKITEVKEAFEHKKAEAEEQKRIEEEEKRKKEEEIANNGGVNPKYGGNNGNDKPKLTIVDGSTGAVSTVGSSSGSVLEIPDTRNDTLQGKRISGIKGITDSQEYYASDYNTKKEENARLAASIKYPSGINRTAGVSQAGNGLSKEDYTRQALLAQANQGNSYAQQNDQAGKKDFYNTGKTNAPVTGNYLGLNTIWQGTIFEVVLTSEINTDLPGEITARIAKNIYSSQDSRYLLIPQNSVIYGVYNSSISYAQSRVQVQWTTLVRPDGYQIDLGAMNGTDAKGASGIKGMINDHPGAYLKAIGLMSVFYIANSRLQNAIDSNSNEYAKNVAVNSQQIVNELGEKLIDRAMNVQPTIKIKAGTKLNVVANKTISLPPVEDFQITQKYKRGFSPKEIY